MVWLIPFILIFLLTSWRILKEWSEGLPIKSKWLWILVGITAIVRLPSILYNQVMNVDEAQTIAHALTLIRFPMPWKGIDFTTNGPLNAYVFYLPHWLGVPLDYVVSHLLLTILLGIISLSHFIIVRNTLGRDTAIASTVPLLAFFAWGQRDDFTHQASEFWCVAALAVALMFFSKVWAFPDRRKWYDWLLIGFFLGMVPFGKPQGVPPAMIAALFIYIYIFGQEKGRSKTVALIMFTVGGMGLGLLFLFLVLWNDAWQDFYELYIVANLNYAAKHAEGNALIPSFLWSWGWNSGATLIFALTLVTCIWGIRQQKAIPKKQVWMGVMLLALTYGGAYAVERAGRPFDHYLLLFLFPGLFLLLAWGLYQIRNYFYRAHWVFALLVLTTAFLLRVNRHCFELWISALRESKVWVLEMSPISQYVKQWASEPTDCITVYGYYNEVYVETGLPSATRLVTVYQHSSIWPELYTPYYLSDLFSNRPVVFVDALDTPQDFRQTFVNRQDHGPEKIPELRQFLDENYQLVSIIDRSRIYVLKERISSRSLEN